MAIYYDFDYYEKIIRVALGENVDFSVLTSAVPNASHLLMSDKDGHIVSQEDCNERLSDGSYADQNLLDVQFDMKPGDEVHKFRIGPHRIGHVITKGIDLQEAVSSLEKAMSKCDY